MPVVSSAFTSISVSIAARSKECPRAPWPFGGALIVFLTVRSFVAAKGKNFVCTG
jgi:hypothetical protein